MLNGYKSVRLRLGGGGGLRQFVLVPPQPPFLLVVLMSFCSVTFAVRLSVISEHLVWDGNEIRGGVSSQQEQQQVSVSAWTRRGLTPVLELSAEGWKNDFAEDLYFHLQPDKC